MLIYIVRRESADGPENDCFEDHELATQWAAITGGEVEEEHTIDHIVLEEMRKSYEGEEVPE